MVRLQISVGNIITTFTIIVVIIFVAILIITNLTCIDIFIIAIIIFTNIIITSIRITEYKYYYEKGNKIHGEYKYYHENGNIKTCAYYKNGHFNKDYKTYDMRAILTQHIFFRDVNKKHEYNKLFAEYINNKLKSYYITENNVPYVILYNNMNE